MNDIIYIKSLLQNNKDIFSKIEKYKNDNILLIKKHNNISQTINFNIDSTYNNINNKFNNLKTDLNYLFSLLAHYNCFSNIILKIKAGNNYYENKILINKKLLEKNDKIINYIEEIFNFCNYRDIITLINKNLLDEIKIDKEKTDFEFTDIDNNSINEKKLDNDFCNNFENNDSVYNDKNLEDKNNIDNEFYKTQIKYYDEIENYIQKMKNDNINYDSKKNEINYQVDKDINNIKELIIIIKNRASRNKLLLENDIQKITDNILVNNNVYNYIYNFSINFKYFNINFYNYFNGKIPKLPLFNNNIDNINNLFFDNFNNVSQELISYSHTVLMNSIPFSFKFSNLKAYFNFLNDFFDITKLKSVLTNFQDTTISNDLLNTFEIINNKFDFIKMREYSMEIIEHIDSFINIHENNINNSQTFFQDLKNDFFSNFISRKILIEDYNSLIYDIILYIIHVNNIQEIDISYLKNILLSKKYISFLIFDKILSYMDSINETYTKLSILNQEEISHEKLFIEKHELFELYNNNLQQLLASNHYENRNEIIQQNKNILTVEDNIKEIVETIDNIKNKIYASENFVSSNKKNILSEIYNIIKYYN
tara:strand:- start:6066 stop:7853 length:1788 start_codon:yes stop_codon:yes gene_type:complete